MEHLYTLWVCKSWSYKRNNIYLLLDQSGGLRARIVISHFTLVPTLSDWAIQNFVFKTHSTPASFPIHLHKYFKTALDPWAQHDFCIKSWCRAAWVAQPVFGSGLRSWSRSSGIEPHIGLLALRETRFSLSHSPCLCLLSRCASLCHVSK